MNYTSRFFQLAAAIGIALVLISLPSAAADYPKHGQPIKLIVAFPAGGGIDVLARTISNRLGEELNGTVIVENRPGAGGMLGTATVAKSAPDGHTLIIASGGPFTVWPNLRTDLSYDPVKDLTAVSLLVTMPLVLVTSPNAGFKDVRDLIAKAASGKLNYASGGNGSLMHIAAEQFKMLAHIEAQHVPYKGTAPAVTDVMAGTVPFTFSDPSAKPQIAAGRLKVLAVTTSTRSSQFPGVPTMIEAGVPGYELMNWYGMAVPAGMPVEIVNKLNKALVKIMKEPGVVKTLALSGMDATSSTPAELNTLIVNEREKWGDLIRKANIKAD